MGKRSSVACSANALFFLAVLRITAQAPSNPVIPSHAAGTLRNDQLAARELELRTYLETHDSSADTHYLLAYTFFLDHQPKDSLSEYTKAAALRKPEAKDLQIVALDYVLLDDYEDADQWMSRSVRDQPENAEALYDLGRIKYTENRFIDAVQAFQNVLKLEPQSIKAENNLGLALEGLGQTENAIAAYKQAIAWQSSPSLITEQPFINLAIVMNNREQPQQAIDLLNRAVVIAPNDPKVYEQLGRAYSKLGNLPEAQTALERAIALSPEDAATHFELGQIYRKQAKMQDAKAEFAAAERLSVKKDVVRQP